jgi:hypothetical protein
MQIAKVTIEKDLSGAREIASLNDVATPSSRDAVMLMGCHVGGWQGSANAAKNGLANESRQNAAAPRSDELWPFRGRSLKKIQ